MNRKRTSIHATTAQLTFKYAAPSCLLARAVRNPGEKSTKVGFAPICAVLFALFSKKTNITSTVGEVMAIIFGEIQRNGTTSAKDGRGHASLI